MLYLYFQDIVYLSFNGNSVIYLGKYNYTTLTNVSGKCRIFNDRKFCSQLI